MPDPIGETFFWKDRIIDAKDRGLLRYSVYNTSANDWDYLCSVHRKICEHYIPKDAKVLDVGCGYGRLSEWFGYYSGIDFSPEFIAEAKRLYPGKEFIVGDIKDMPYTDKEFDWAICISIKGMVIRELGDVQWLKMEKEIKRVAKNILLLEYSSPSEFDAIQT